MDAFLDQSGIFRENEEKVDCIMDSDAIERERGITIYSKNCSIKYEDRRPISLMIFSQKLIQAVLSIAQHHLHMLLTVFSFRVERIIHLGIARLQIIVENNDMPGGNHRPPLAGRMAARCGRHLSRSLKNCEADFRPR